MAARHVVDSVVLVINPAAGGGSAGNRGDEFASLLRSVGTASVRSLVPQDVAATERVLRELAAEGVSRVVLAGGDGMVHAAVNAFANTPTVLGILPVGSGNDFARGVGLLANNLPAAAIAAVVLMRKSRRGNYFRTHG